MNNFLVDTGLLVFVVVFFVLFSEKTLFTIRISVFSIHWKPWN
ncbi:hypothetical protein EV690_0093 [Celerinatantimonas diazotrophica]|uniref:Uncharacterized protein n=1 Tax=Celerinatantimonas diazotrophica TaxID=412034 RepID=A0A4R1KI90_9GAMM|nr:hypothetical protein EV690_0093 [Celerinatantimonas diazotrophica]CAG9297064.1 hypothetical protein CEDIAZO_02226 [Celerinatantimonas diazotrophica]